MTPATSSTDVSLPTIMETALLPASTPSVLSASYTLMLSTRRHFVARICHVMTASAIIPAYRFMLYAATIIITDIAKVAKITVKARSIPLLYFIRFNFFSEILYPASQLSLLSRKEMSEPISLTGCGIKCGSPINKSSTKPAINAKI